MEYTWTKIKSWIQEYLSSWKTTNFGTGTYSNTGSFSNNGTISIAQTQVNINADSLSVLRAYKGDSKTVINSDTDSKFKSSFYFRDRERTLLAVGGIAINFAPSGGGAGYIGSYSSTIDPNPVEDASSRGMSLMQTTSTDFDIVNKKTIAINVVVVCSAGIKSYTIQANSKQNISGLEVWSLLLVLWCRVRP